LAQERRSGTGLLSGIGADLFDTGARSLSKARKELSEPPRIQYGRVIDMASTVRAEGVHLKTGDLF